MFHVLGNKIRMINSQLLEADGSQPIGSSDPTNPPSDRHPVDHLAPFEVRVIASGT